MIFFGLYPSLLGVLSDTCLRGSPRIIGSISLVKFLHQNRSVVPLISTVTLHGNMTDIRIVSSQEPRKTHEDADAQ